MKKFGPGPIGAKTICQEFRKFEISRNAAVSMVRFSHLTQDRRSVNIHKKSNPWEEKLRIKTSRHKTQIKHRGRIKNTNNRKHKIGRQISH